MTETEQKVENQTQTDYQSFSMPEFKPFNFGEEPAFEVEKQYNFDTNQYKEDEKRQMEFPSLEKSEQTVQKTVAKSEIVARPRLNARGKIIVAVYSIIVAIVLSLCIFNAVGISSLKNEIAAKSEIVATQTEVINELELEYNSLGDEDVIKSKLDGFRTATDEDIVQVKRFKLSTRKHEEQETNWFEEFCTKLLNLFI